MTEPRIGELRHLVRLESPLATPDGAGGQTLQYALIGEVWCKLLPRDGSEQGAGEGEFQQASNTHEVWLRWRGDVTSEMRFVLGSRVLEITSVVDVDERHRWLKCLATERRP